MDLFNLELAERAYQKSGLAHPEEVRLIGGGWWSNLGVILGGRSFVIGHAIHLPLLEYEPAEFLPEYTEQDWIEALFSMREQERYGVVGYRLRLAWRWLKGALGVS